MTYESHLTALRYGGDGPEDPATGSSSAIAAGGIQMHLWPV